MIFIGPNGTDKTHLAIGLALCACRQGKRVRFLTAPSLVNELIEARKDYRLSRIEAYYHKLDLLVIDELGFVPFAREAAELLFGVCAGRYERHSTLITSNTGILTLDGGPGRCQPGWRAGGPAHPPRPHRARRRGLVPIPAQPEQSLRRCWRRQRDYGAADRTTTPSKEVDF